MTTIYDRILRAPRRLADNSPPDGAGQVVTLDEAKAHLRVDDNDEDELIEALIEAAIESAEKDLQRSLVSKRWAISYTDFTGDQGGRLRLPFPDVTSILGVAYLDGAGDEQTFDADSYSIQHDVVGSYLGLLNGSSWPSGYATRDDAVTISFVAGYGDADDVPKPIKMAILRMVSDMFEQRETFVIGQAANEVPMSATVKSLLRPYKYAVPLA